MQWILTAQAATDNKSKEKMSSTQEINGYSIEIFNQYDLPVGKKESPCPLCSHERTSKNQKAKCASLDWERGLGTCHHCGEVFQIHTFQRKHGNKTYSKPIDNKSMLDQKVVKWFKSRGISEKTLTKAKVTTRPNWIEFNFYAYGEIVNRKSRNAKKNFLLEKNCEMVWYNHDALFNHDSIIITEGEIDVLSFMESGYNNVLSVPNGAKNFSFLDTSIDLFDGVERILLSIDDDEAGRELQTELIRRFGAEKCYIISLPGAKDANEYLVSNSTDALRVRVDGANPVPLDNVKTLNDIADEFDEFVLEGAKPGFQIGLEEFDSVFSTYTSQFIVVTGIPGHGKSDWIDMMTMGYNQKYNWKIAYASPENKPDYIHGHKIWRKHYGAPTKEDVGTEAFIEKRQHLSENFFFIDMDHFTIENVLKKGSELVKRKGIRCLVIDPYNKVRMTEGKGMSIPDYTMEYLTKVDTWSKKHDCLVILAAHPRKMNRQESGEFDEPTFYDVKGGGEFYDMSYHGLSVYRDFTQKHTKVKVLKCKFQNLGTNGAETFFNWEPKTGRFEEKDTTAVSAKLPWEGDTPF